MDPLFTVVLTIRKLFGFLLPGFVWLLLVLIWNPANLQAIVRSLRDTPASSAFLVAAGLVISYYLGTVASTISFRVSELLADSLDSWLSRLRNPMLRRLIQSLNRRFHILSLTTLEQDRARLLTQLSGDSLLQIPVTDEPGSTRFGILRMFVLERTPVLAKEVLDVEGEINFAAGLWVPSLVAGAWLWQEGWTILGAALCLAAAYLVFRFENLRHHELLVVEKTYVVARHLTTMKG